MNNLMSETRLYWAMIIYLFLGCASTGPVTSQVDTKKNSVADKKMDLHNNSKGIQFGSSYTGSGFESDCVEVGFQKIKDRELVWLK